MWSACTCRIPRQTNHIETRFQTDAEGTLMTVRMTFARRQDTRANACDRHGTGHGSEL